MAASQSTRDPSVRRSSYMPPPTAKPAKKERFRTGSLVVANQTSLLHPFSNSTREFSLESGYVSHDGSTSTPNSPKKFILPGNQTGKRARLSGGTNGGFLSQSASEEETHLSPQANYMGEVRHSTARDKRLLFLR